MAPQIIFFLLLFTSHSSSRRILHQPFFPVTDSPPPPPPPLPPPFTTQSPSPSPQPQPQPQPQPKHPFSSLTPTTADNHRFFPSYTTPPPSPTTTTTTASLPTFPANISSISLPSSSSSSSKSHVSTKLLLLSLTFSFLAIAFISAIIASLLYHRNHTHKPPPPDSLRLFPANHHTSDKPSPPPTLPPNFSTPSSEFLYLGTLVSPLHDQTPFKTSASASSGSAAATIDYHRMGSPELHPLPPLPRQDFRHQHNLNDDYFSDSELLPPPPPPPLQPPPPPPRGFAGKERTEEILKPKLKPLHWDKLRASSEKATAWDHLKISSFQ